MKLHASTVAILALGMQCAFGEEAAPQGMPPPWTEQLTDANFPVKFDKPSLVGIVADGCPHCTKVKPELKAAADAGAPVKTLNWGHIRGGADPNTTKVAKHFEDRIKGGQLSFPTMILSDKNGEILEEGRAPLKADEMQSYVNGVPECISQRHTYGPEPSGISGWFRTLFGWDDPTSRYARGADPDTKGSDYYTEYATAKLKDKCEARYHFLRKDAYHATARTHDPNELIDTNALKQLQDNGKVSLISLEHKGSNPKEVQKRQEANRLASEALEGKSIKTVSASNPYAEVAYNHLYEQLLDDKPTRVYVRKNGNAITVLGGYKGDGTAKDLESAVKNVNDCYDKKGPLSEDGSGHTFNGDEKLKAECEKQFAFLKQRKPVDPDPTASGAASWSTAMPYIYGAVAFGVLALGRFCYSWWNDTEPAKSPADSKSKSKPITKTTKQSQPVKKTSGNAKKGAQKGDQKSTDQPKSGTEWFLIILLIVLALAAVGAALYFFVFSKSGEDEDEDMVDEILQDVENPQRPFPNYASREDERGHDTIDTETPYEITVDEPEQRFAEVVERYQTGTAPAALSPTSDDSQAMHIKRKLAEQLAESSMSNSLRKQEDSGISAPDAAELSASGESRQSRECNMPPPVNAPENHPLTRFKRLTSMSGSWRKSSTEDRELSG